MQQPAWYLKRLRSMSGAEIAYRQEKIRNDFRPVRTWIRLRGDQTEK
jgi:hypothetical protein